MLWVGTLSAWGMLAGLEAGCFSAVGCVFEAGLHLDGLKREQRRWSRHFTRQGEAEGCGSDFTLSADRVSSPTEEDTGRPSDCSLVEDSLNMVSWGNNIVSWDNKVD